MAAVEDEEYIKLLARQVAMYILDTEEPVRTWGVAPLWETQPLLQRPARPLWPTTAPPPEPQAATTPRALLPIGPACQYVQRVQQNSTAPWTCPPNTVDTGYEWGDRYSDKQCLTGCDLDTTCQYQTRMQQADVSWACPPGWSDTGMARGVPDGERQCQQCPPPS